MSNINDDECYISSKIEKFISSRRPALLMIRYFGAEDNLDLLRFPDLWRVIDQVPVFVWPNPTPNGGFIVEHEDGRCETVPPYNLKFLDSEKEFNQYNLDKYMSNARTCHMKYCPELSDEKFYSTEAYQCSICGNVTLEDKPKYCPNCGAKVTG